MNVPCEVKPVDPIKAGVIVMIQRRVSMLKAKLSRQSYGSTLMR